MMIKLFIPFFLCVMHACGQAQSGVPVEIKSPPADAPAQPQESEAPNATEQEPRPHIADEVNSLLDRLEQSAGDLKTFTADIRYEKSDALLGRKELRAGDLIYRNAPESNDKSFAIRFDSTIIDNVRRSEPKHYIFSQRWLAEVDAKNKQFIKREIVPPGKTLDPLKLGEGPFPLPIGQPKSEVLLRFDVTGAEVPKDGLLKDLQNVQGLMLVPKAGVREAKEFTKVVLFYDRDLLLPVGIVTEETNGEVKVIRLLNANRNPELTAEQTKALSIEEPDPREWRIDVRPWSDE